MSSLCEIFDRLGSLENIMKARMNLNEIDCIFHIVKFDFLQSTSIKEENFLLKTITSDW